MAAAAAAATAAAAVVAARFFKNIDERGDSLGAIFRSELT